MIYKANKNNPPRKAINEAVKALKAGGIIIFATDTVYSYGCLIQNKKSLLKITGFKEKDYNISLLCKDISQVNQYVRNISNEAFKIMKKACPGPYKFIFNSSKKVPKTILTLNKTITVKIAESNIVSDLIDAAGEPIVAASVNQQSGEYLVDPQELEKKYKNEVNLVLDSGILEYKLSTIVDFSSGRVDIVREGAGELFF